MWYTWRRLVCPSALYVCSCCPKLLASEFIGLPGVQTELVYGSHPVLCLSGGCPSSKIIFREPNSGLAAYKSQVNHCLGCTCSSLWAEGCSCLLPFQRVLCGSDCLHVVKDSSSNKLGWNNHFFPGKYLPWSGTVWWDQGDLCPCSRWQCWALGTQLHPSLSVQKQVSVMWEGRKMLLFWLESQIQWELKCAIPMLISGLVRNDVVGDVASKSTVGCRKYVKKCV